MSGILSSHIEQAGRADLLSSLLTAANDVVWCTSVDGAQLLYINPAAERVYGRPLREFLQNQQLWLQAIHPDDRPGVEQQLQELLERRQVEQEYRIVRPDGQIRWLRDRVNVVYDERGYPARIGGIATDITDRKSAEEALRESEAVYHSLVESLPVNIVRKDLQGRVVFANQRYCQALHCNLSELVGRTDFDLFPRELAEKYTADDRRVLNSGELLHDVEQHQTPDGTKLFVEVLKCPVRNSAGQNVGVQVVFWDVSERKQMEAALEYERYLLHTLMDNLPDAIYFKDTESRFVRLSRALARKFGMADPAEAIGKTDAHFFTAEHAGQALADERRVMETGQPLVNREEKETWQDGTVTWASTTKLPLYDVDGRLIGTFGISRDVTTRKMAEEELARTNEELQNEIRERQQVEERLARERDLLRTLIDNLPDLIFFKDIECRYILANQALLRIVGAHSLDDVVGRTDLELANPELAQQYVADDQEVIRTGWPLVDREETIEDTEGHVLWMLITKVPLKDANGNVVGLVGIGRNITTRKLALEQLRAAKEAADAANRAKGDFLANMSHEIRTPMNAIIGMTELLLDSPLSHTQREYLELVRDSGDLLLTVINDILDFSKIEAEKLELETASFNLHEMLGDALKSVGLRAHNRGIELAFHIEPDVPAMVEGDAMRLRQVVVNLVGNAIKFTDEGEVVLHVACEQLDDHHVRLQFSVRDTGIGIAPYKQQRIFEAFEQADSSTTRRHGGTGLGLAICSRLVALMGGRIWVESEMGAGSQFHFTARFRLTDQAADSGAPRPVIVSDTAVLVVDDNATNRRILEAMFTNWGMRPTCASDAPQALAALRAAQDDEHPFRLVVTDVNMPGTDGFTLSEWIRNDPRLRAVPILVLSSGIRPGDGDRCEKLGISAELMKPVKQSELFDAVVLALGVSDSETGQSAAQSAQAPPAVALRVLLAEDNAINQKLAAGVLNRLGHRVTIVPNGREAVQATESGAFDVVLMDVQMPEMDGLEATRLIRQREQTTGRHLPIIAMTAHAMKGDRERCLDAGMDDYLPKPIRVAQLSEKLLGTAAVQHPHVSAADSSPDAPVADWEEALRNVNGDPELLRLVVLTLRDEEPRLIEEVRQAVARRDAEGLRCAAHCLKGSLLFLGNTRAKGQAWRLEQRGAKRQLDHVDEQLECLEVELDLLRLHLEQFLDSGTGQTPTSS